MWHSQTEIDQIVDLDALESLMRRVLATLDRDVIERELRAGRRAKAARLKKTNELWDSVSAP